jgi:hypothetical protein
VFRHHALAVLSSDGFNETEIGRLLPTPGHRFAKTNSRPVTGSMNDHIWHTQYYFAHEGGIHGADVLTINRRLNDTAMGALGPGTHMDFAIKVLTRIIRPSGAA